MPECLPFCGYLYNKEKVSIQEVLAPPYDVVDEKEIEFYKNKSPYNIFHLELPETPQKAKLLLDKLIEEQILVRNSIPTIYYHELHFRFRNKAHIRKGYILLVKLYDYEERIVIPHEHTFKKVTEERFELLKTTQFQFSQIHGLYDDPTLYTLNLVNNFNNLYFEVSLNEEIHKLYKIQDDEIISKLTDFLLGKKIYIADGHHRYNTALKYKDYMSKIHGNNKNKDFNFMAMYLTPIDDPNLLMLPTHRLYTFEDVTFFLHRIKPFTEVLHRHKKNSLEEIIESYNNRGDIFIVLTDTETYIVKIRSDIYEILCEKEPELSKLPLFSFLYILKETFHITEEYLKEKGLVKFFSDPQRLSQELQMQRGFGVLFPAVSPLVLKEVTIGGKLMPHKSTYFYPKILSGLVILEVSGKSLR